MKEHRSPSLDKLSDAWSYERQANRSLLTEAAVRSQFDHSAAFYRSLIEAYLPRNLDEYLLDVPCGEGGFLYVLRQLGYTCCKGYDIDLARLQVASRLQLPVFAGDAFEALGSHADSSVGGCISMDFLEHLEKGDAIRFIELVRDKLKPRGVFVVRTPCADGPFGCRHIFNDFTHKWAATSGVLRQLLTGAGFAGVTILGEEPRWAMRFGWIRVPCFRISRAIANGFLRCLGVGPIQIWSSSMWGVGFKP